MGGVAGNRQVNMIISLAPEKPGGGRRFTSGKPVCVPIVLCSSGELDDGLARGTAGQGAGKPGRSERRMPMRPDAPQVLATVAMDLHEERSPNRTLAALTRHAWHLVGTGDAGLLTRRPDGSMRSAACTHRLVSRAHDLQIRLADGPSLSCMHDGTAIVVHDLTTEQRWPEWAARAADLDRRSMMAVALGTPDERVGV